eukprot:9069795-Ditylum_brightwellii.AAC.1
MLTARTCPDTKTTPILLPLKTKNADGQELSRHEDNIDLFAPQEKKARHEDKTNPSTPSDINPEDLIET